jgi:GNAT superfamily N-acetyltransferase
MRGISPTGTRASSSIQEETMEIVIRLAKKSDYPAVSELFTQVNSIHASGRPDIFQNPEVPVLSEEYFNSFFDTPDQTLFVADADGTVIGVVTIQVRDAPDQPMLVPRRFGVIETMSVAKGWRSKGIGQNLMVAAEEWAKKAGATSMNLNVWTFNRRASRFYERHGYLPLHTRMSKEFKEF